MSSEPTQKLVTVVAAQVPVLASHLRRAGSGEGRPHRLGDVRGEFAEADPMRRLEEIVAARVMLRATAAWPELEGIVEFVSRDVPAEP